jgi:hypothetical protein
MRAFSVRDLIIETQQQVQKLGGFKRDATSEHRIAWRLNTAQDILVRNKIKPSITSPGRFMIDEPSRQAIQSLITPNKRLAVHKQSATRGFAYLPYDYGYLVADRSIVLPDCKTEYADPTEATTYRVTSIPFNDSPLNVGPYYVNITARSTASGVHTDDTKIYNLSNKKEKYEIVDSIIAQFASLSTVFGAYWESFDTIQKPNSFIIVHQVVGAQTNLPTHSLLIDGQEAVAVTQTISTTKYKAYADGEEKPNRSYQNDFLYDAITHNYYDQPKPHTPVAQLANGMVYVFNSKRFLVPELIIDYIRKPRRISVYLDQSTELDSSVHYELCCLAAEQILGNVEGNYPTKVQDNIRIQ